MDEYRLAIRLMIAGVLLTGMGVWALITLTGGALEEVRYLGFVLLIAGLAAIVVGVVLWPRSRKAMPPPGEEPTPPDSVTNPNGPAA
jgi:hypothetical protein